MDISRDTHTELLLMHGDVQASPQHAAMLNEGPSAKFISDVDRGAANAGYAVVLTGYAHFVLLQEQRTGTSAYLDKLLVGLRSVPRPLSAKVLKGSVSTFSNENDFYRIDYRVANGQVMVYNIQPVDRLQKQRDRMEQVALYRVKRNGQGVWQAGVKVTSVTTAYAAVNGQSNNLTKATWLMGAHLEYEFKNLQEYTLFHNPSEGGGWDAWESFRDKMGLTTPTTRTFAKVLADTQGKGNSTQWVAHSQGGIIFAEGVRYLLNGSSSWALNRLFLNGIRNPDKATLLDKHRVAFHGNANNNLRSKPLFKRAGVEVISIRTNDFDLVPNIAGMNTLNPWKVLGSIVYSSHVFAGSVAQSPHTLAQSQESWNEHMKNGPGKGRNGLQKTFNKLDAQFNKAKSTPNYLP